MPAATQLVSLFTIALVFCTQTSVQGAPLEKHPSSDLDFRFDLPSKLVASSGDDVEVSKRNMQMEGILIGRREFPAEGVMLGKRNYPMEGIMLGRREFPTDGIMIGKRDYPIEGIMLGRREFPTDGVLLGRREFPAEGVLLGRRNSHFLPAQPLLKHHQE